jgi:predicted membrane GTPase involved in stress response
VPHRIFDRRRPAAGADHHARLQRIHRAHRHRARVCRLSQAGKQVTVITARREHQRRSVAQLQRFDGLGRRNVDRIEVGDLFAVVGLEQVDIGDTLADINYPVALPPVKVDEPTLEMVFRINDGPFGGREGSTSPADKCVIASEQGTSVQRRAAGEV